MWLARHRLQEFCASTSRGSSKTSGWRALNLAELLSVLGTQVAFTDDGPGFEMGDREGALEELRYVHEVFTRLGCRFELEKTIGQFGENDAEPPN